MSAYLLVNVGMTVSVIFFVVGYIFRRQVSTHRILMICGVLTNLASAGILLVAVYVFYAGDHRLAGFVPTVPAWAILVHRVLASAAFLLMLAMAITGALRVRKWHVRLHYFFLPLYLLVYITGLLFFNNGA